jgi:hypothetical protein
MANATVFEIVLEEESLTVTLTKPGAATSEADTAAARSALSPKVVLSIVPFHSVTDDGVKPLPLMRSVKSPCPAIA